MSPRDLDAPTPESGAGEFSAALLIPSPPQRVALALWVLMLGAYPLPPQAGEVQPY